MCCFTKGWAACLSVYLIQLYVNICHFFLEIWRTFTRIFLRVLQSEFPFSDRGRKAHWPLTTVTYCMRHCYGISWNSDDNNETNCMLSFWPLKWRIMMQKAHRPCTINWCTCTSTWIHFQVDQRIRQGVIVTKKLHSHISLIYHILPNLFTCLCTQAIIVETCCWEGMPPYRYLTILEIKTQVGRLNHSLFVRGMAAAHFVRGMFQQGVGFDDGWNNNLLHPAIIIHFIWTAVMNEIAWQTMFFEWSTGAILLLGKKFYKL